MILYYITERTEFAGEESARQERLLECMTAAAQAGVDYIQLREKDLPAGNLEDLARRCMAASPALAARLLISTRVDVAIAVGAAGVHLPAGGISPLTARELFRSAGVTHPVIAVSCHSVEEVRVAESEGADFVVFGPVFEKDGLPGTGLERLRYACCGQRIPVLALGGVTPEHASVCVDAGAAGVAGIRLFQSGDISQMVARLRAK